MPKAQNYFIDSKILCCLMNAAAAPFTSFDHKIHDFDHVFWLTTLNIMIDVCKIPSLVGLSVGKIIYNVATDTSNPPTPDVAYGIGQILLPPIGQTHVALALMLH